MNPDWQKQTFRDPDEQSSWWLINFYLEVPFYVPYLDGATFNVQLNREAYIDPPDDLKSSSPFVLMKVIQRRTPAQEPVPPIMQTILAELRSQGRWAPPELQTDKSVAAAWNQLNLATIVEAITPKVLLKSEHDRGLPLHPGVLVDRCLSAFSRWMSALALVTRDWNVRSITKEQLPPTQAFFHQNPQTGKLVRMDVLQAHPNIPWSSNVIVNPHTANAIALMAANTEDHHTVWAAAEWFMSAQRLAAVDGQYEMAVVSLHTSGELLIYGVAVLALVDEGVGAQAIERMVQRRVSLADACYAMLQPRFGGQWDRKLAASAFGRYWKNVVLRRNDVVHRGGKVSIEQAIAAQEGMANMIDFVIRRVERRRHSYPRTLMDLLNVFGVPEGVVVGKAFDRRARSIVATAPRYWLPADDPRRNGPPSVLAQTDAGQMPSTVTAEKRAEWQAADVRPFHLVLRPPAHGTVSPSDQPASNSHSD